MPIQPGGEPPMFTVKFIDSNNASAYRAAGFEPFGAGSILLRGAWAAEWTGTRREGQGDARTIILPAPFVGHRVEITEDAAG